MGKKKTGLHLGAKGYAEAFMQRLDITGIMPQQGKGFLLLGGLLAFILMLPFEPAQAALILKAAHKSHHPALRTKKPDNLMLSLYARYKQLLTHPAADENPMDQYKLWLKEWGAFAREHHQYWRYGQFGTLSTIAPHTHAPRGQTMRIVKVKAAGLVLVGAQASGAESGFMKGQRAAFLIQWHLGNVVYEFELRGRLEPYVAQPEELIALPDEAFHPHILLPEKGLISLGKFYGQGESDVRPIYTYAGYTKTPTGWRKQNMDGNAALFMDG